MILIVRNSFLFLLSLTFYSTRSSELSPREQVLPLMKLLNIPCESELEEYYCPKKHTLTLIKDLCFYVTFTRRSRSTARENCFKKSHRLVEIDTNLTWNALISTLNKIDEIKLSDAKFFHVGVLRLQDNSSTSVAKYVWNHSEVEFNSNLLCNNQSDNRAPLSTFKCVELIVRSLNSSCLTIKECNRVLSYSICEWRGHDIEDFSLVLRRELIHSYYAIIVVSVLYAIIWYFFYLIHKMRTKDERNALLKLHEYEQRISNLDVKNIQFNSHPS